MTRSPSCSSKRFKVYEFDEDDERVEVASVKFLGKFRNPRRKLQLSPIDNYKFLECYGRGTRTQQMDFQEPIDVDAEVAEVVKTPQKEITDKLLDVDTCTYNVSYPMGMPQEDGAFKAQVSGLDAILVSNSSNFEIEPVSMISDDDDKIETSSSSTSVSSLAENEVPLKERVLEHGSRGHEIDVVNMSVVVFPDFILYGDMYCTESSLTFLCGCIKVEGSTVNGTKGTFSFECIIGDIINIESRWCRKVETAIVNLLLKSKDSKGAANANESSGIEMLKFAVYDPCWSEVQEAIKSLDVRYKDIWNAIFDTGRENEESALLGQKNNFLFKRYISDFDESFEDVIYPKGDPDAVSISKRDVELLQPDTFINDTIIDFYIKYLKNKIQPEEQHRFHFFNSFFFRKLADLDKDPSAACEGRAAFQRVRKWTRKVNLFEKDYIFIPVNYSLHWSLIVICHPGEVAQFRADEVENSPKVPCILHMDSIKGSHRGLKNLIQSYLCEEWKERHSETVDDVASKFLHLRFVPLELPQQENSFDCGLFLLHYVQLFLEEAPTNFNPFEITKFSNFLNRDWFSPAEASLKRAYIRKLIYEILEDHSPKDPSTDRIDKYPFFLLPDKNEKDAGVEFLEEICSAEQENEISLLAASPPRVVQYITDSGSVCKQLFVPGISAGSFCDGNYPQMASLHERSIMSPIEEVEETGDQCADSPSDSNDFKTLGASWKQPCPFNLEEDDEGDSTSGTSISGSQNSSEVGPDMDKLLPEFEGFNHLERTHKPESSSTSSERLAACVAEDSQEANDMHDDKGKDSPSSFQGNILNLSQQEVDLTVNVDSEENKMPVSADPVPEADEQKAAKRPSLMPPEEGTQPVKIIASVITLL